MRLSTNAIYALNVKSIQGQQSRVTDIGEQLATGRRINAPSDDPRGAAQLLNLQQSQQANEQFGDNRASAQRQISNQLSYLDSAGEALDSAKSNLVRAANGTLNDADRASLADELEGALNQVTGSANARDASGNYMFSGFETNTRPFDADNGYAYAGDAGQRSLQIDGSRDMSLNTAGSNIFASTTATADYVPNEPADNNGTGRLGSLRVDDASADDFGDSFSVAFSQDAGDGTTYSVTNDTTGETISANQAFSPGQRIALGESLSIDIKGSPADGDSYSFAQGDPQDSNILSGLSDVIDRLREPASGEAGRARQDNAIGRANRQVDNALDNIFSQQSQMGAQLNEIDSLDAAAGTRSVESERQISDLRDVDMTRAISEFSLSRTALQAARSTFNQISQMGIFGQ